MAGIAIEGLNIQTKVIEPFPHIPNLPGIYSTCLPEGTHNIQLQFNSQNTFSMSITIPSKGIQFVEPFIGGVFRKYGKRTSVEAFINLERIPSSSEGDVRTLLNPTGLGTYLTNLSLIPNIDASIFDIAKNLRLYTPGTFTLGDPASKGIVESERASGYVDLAIDTRAIYLESTNDFPLQFVLPSASLDFVLPGKNLHSILIDKLIQ